MLIWMHVGTHRDLVYHHLQQYQGQQNSTIFKKVNLKKYFGGSVEIAHTTCLRHRQTFQKLSYIRVCANCCV